MGLPPGAALLLWASVSLSTHTAAAETTPSPCSPVISAPNPVYVAYGGSIFINCTTMCHSAIGTLGWETSLKKSGRMTGPQWISTNLTDINEWVSLPKCFLVEAGQARITSVTIRAYEAPKDVLIEVPRVMELGQSYAVICRATQVAPKRYLTVSVKRGNETVYTEMFAQDLTDSSIDVMVNHNIIAQRRDHGAEYTCLAQLDLRPNGEVFGKSSPPESVSVIGPPIVINVSAERTEFQEGDNFTVTCHAEGNPPPMITWHLPSNESSWTTDQGARVTIISARVAHSGTYQCRAWNRYGNSTASIDIKLKDNPAPGFPAWAAVVCLCS
ncbi:intercellular adhesion molecule 4-like isoform X2 [Ambystoma mexicanum]|uniref:intercellular adhesion molecule 4-like isoform X2 n=1 Tax=Ambystoma mexicanum TaxID=8296 RepID=UPI0037E8B876